MRLLLDDLTTEPQARAVEHAVRELMPGIVVDGKIQSKALDPQTAFALVIILSDYVVFRSAFSKRIRERLKQEYESPQTKAADRVYDAVRARAVAMRDWVQEVATAYQSAVQIRLIMEYTNAWLLIPSSLPEEAFEQLALLDENLLASDDVVAWDSTGGWHQET